MQVIDSNESVKTILCIADVPGGQTLSAVELDDGRLALYLNRRRAHPATWQSEKLNDCIDTFLAMKWELLHPADSHILTH
jgi:hypothetical protein